jgi:uncharacterized protein YeaO (DUF488 family)
MHQAMSDRQRALPDPNPAAARGLSCFRALRSSGSALTKAALAIRGRAADLKCQPRVQLMISIKRVYDPPAKEDGSRFLVERLWPRGMKKEALPMTAWCKQVAPSTELRQWFSHDPAKWKEFQHRYRGELAGNRAACQPLFDAAQQGDITLLYSAHDTDHNSALVLKSYLEEGLTPKKSAR